MATNAAPTGPAPRPKQAPVIFILIHALLFLVVFMVIAQLFYPATGELELYLSSKIMAGQVPYRDFPVEYPPLSLLFFLLPRMIFSTLPAYSFIFALELLAADAVIIFLIYRLAPRLNASPWHLLGAYTLLLVGTGPLVMCRYDLLPAAFLMASLYAFIKGKPKLAGVMVALNITAKLYGAVVLPLFLIYYLINRRYKQLLQGSLAFLATIVVLIVPWLLVSFSGFANFLGYHLQRGVEAESTYGTALLMGQVLGIARANIAHAYGSWNIVSPPADFLSRLSLYLSAAALLAVYAGFARAIWKRKTDNPDVALIFKSSSLTVLVVLVTAKVLSAQYLIWLCPLLPLITGKGKYTVWALFVLAGALTQYEFPYHLAPFNLGETVPVIAMALRNLCLLVIIVLITKLPILHKVFPSCII